MRPPAGDSRKRRKQAGFASGQAERGRVRDLPERLRPREAFARLGARQVSDQDLLAIILRSGMRGVNVVDLAARLLATFGSLNGLARAPIADLLALPGIGPVKAMELKAALELARRLSEELFPPGTQIDSPGEACRVLRETARTLDHEVFWVLPLDSRNRLDGHPVEVTHGIRNASLVHAREVFQVAIRSSGVALILAHNHPSGDPTPSAEDIKITRQLIEAGRVLDIRVLDHIILGHPGRGNEDGFLSLRESGLVSFEG